MLIGKKLGGKVGRKVRGLNFRLADLLYANGNSKTHSCKMFPKDLQSTLVKHLGGGNIKKVILTIKSQQEDKDVSAFCLFLNDGEEVLSGTFIRAIQFVNSKNMRIIAEYHINIHHIRCRVLI